jgi:hypothetical protein
MIVKVFAPQRQKGHKVRLNIKNKLYVLCVFVVQKLDELVP